MSARYNDVSEVPTTVICERLRELSEAVTTSDSKVRREFTMRVPAEVDRDADIVLSAAADRLAAAEQRLAEIAELPEKWMEEDSYYGSSYAENINAIINREDKP